jgi:predicted nucleotidyltransferase component of viral defense system
MKRNKILTNFQIEVLKEISKSQLSSFFIWSGGTALSFYYLKHRLSYDLDFLSQELIPEDYILAEIKKISKNLKIKKIEEQKRFNRYEFWFKKNKDSLKIEFVFYPFPFIEKPKKIKDLNIKIDSIKDILTNKAHAIFERSEPKDVFDFYCILVYFPNIKQAQIFKWIEKKFGVIMDPVLFYSKVLRGADNLNLIKPLILKKDILNVKKIKEYFKKQAEDYLRKKIKK